MSQTIIAIDGPAGSGKSTVAMGVADRLDFLHLNTGAMYRALTLKVLQNNIAITDTAAIIALLPETQISFQKKHDNSQTVLLDGGDVTFEIRGSDVAQNVSPVAAIPEVRTFMVEQQRKIAEGTSVVTEGRDTTTVVFPYAQYKFYLDADVEERAKRCYNDFVKRGQEITFDQVKQDLIRRDHIDSTREIAPLTKADDAIVLDTSHLTPAQVIDEILKRVSD